MLGFCAFSSFCFSALKIRYALRARFGCGRALSTPAAAVVSEVVAAGACPGVDAVPCAGVLAGLSGTEAAGVCFLAGIFPGGFFGVFATVPPAASNASISALYRSLPAAASFS